MAGPIRISIAIGTVTFALLAATPATAQQPFYTDDAEVTAPKRLDLEFSNEFDVLQRSAYPNLRQNTAELEIDYGLLPSTELGISAPLLIIDNAISTQPKTAVGVGDTSISIKYRFGSQPAVAPRTFALSASFEIPTGDRRQQLGSGVADFGVNAIAQQRVGDRVTLRANAGLLLAGNTLTGVIGLRGRGLVASGGASVVRQMSPALHLGIEITGAFTPRETGLEQAQLQFQVGGSWLLSNALALDFGVLAGRFDTSPRIGAQLGLSVDF